MTAVLLEQPKSASFAHSSLAALRSGPYNPRAEFHANLQPGFCAVCAVAHQDVSLESCSCSNLMLSECFLSNQVLRLSIIVTHDMTLLRGCFGRFVQIAAESSVSGGFLVETCFQIITYLYYPFHCPRCNR